MHIKQHTLQAFVKNLQAAQHDINLSEAISMVKRFRRFKKQLAIAARKQSEITVEPPRFPDSLAYNSAALFRLMKTPGCIGIRCYPAIDDQQQFKLVFIGIDEQGNNIIQGESNETISLKSSIENRTTGLLNEGQASPPFPPPTNEL